MSQSTPINLLRRGGEQNQEGNSNIESLPNFSMNSSDSPIMQNNNEFVNP